ncbi:Serine--pyruvate aminotransferase, L-alanine:glyoxylate aminotransferase [Raoultella ornithinolytica]|nr:Serine--pyruvate aminotransferase, L-alanine:glyoxylate aminotransferase [Raoultella ornithinolytica]
MDIAQFSQLNPPPRLLMGPGPINADPRVLRAMSSQLIGQYDPAMTHYMNEVMALYRGVFRTENRWTMLVDGTSRAGIEAILVSAIRPGDKVLVPVFGRFGHLLCEIARRCRAEVHTIEVPWGEVFTPDRIEDAIKRVRPRLLLTGAGRHLDHHAPAAGGAGRYLSPSRGAVLHRRDCLAGRQRPGDRCLGAGCGVGRHAEMPRRPVRNLADYPQRAHGGGDSPPQMRGGGHSYRRPP